MREILFKAKRKDNGEWVEGDLSYIVHNKEKMYIFPANGLDSADRYEIDPDTLCQYTGLKDKNGNRIWENDIVKDKLACLLGPVIWYCDDYAGWFLDDEYPEWPQMMSKDMWEDCEVIGNAFDNQELLKPIHQLKSIHQLGGNMERLINTPEEAIETIKANMPTSGYYMLREALEMAINALKKDIATQPDIEGDGYADGHIVYDTWICPTCRRDYEMEYQEYERCPHCGQLIDWSIKEECAEEEEE